MKTVTFEPLIGSLRFQRHILSKESSKLSGIGESLEKTGGPAAGAGVDLAILGNHFINQERHVGIERCIFESRLRLKVFQHPAP